MGTIEDTSVLAEMNKQIRPLHKREVLWGLSIILGLTLAPAVSDIYLVYFK